jgi:hypothetical protein
VGEMRSAYAVLVRYLRGRDYLRDLGVDGIIYIYIYIYIYMDLREMGCTGAD